MDTLSGKLTLSFCCHFQYADGMANSVDSDQNAPFGAVWPRGYKTIFMLNSAEHEIFPAHKCKNANNCWHFNLYGQEK